MLFLMHNLASSGGSRTLGQNDMWIAATALSAPYYGQGLPPSACAVDYRLFDWWAG